MADDGALRDIYRHRFSEADKAEKDRIWRVLVTSFFQRWIPPTHTVLDLGCGYGEFLNHLRAARRLGVDLNPDSPRHLASGVEFHSGSVCDLGFLSDGSVDTVFTSNVMEHMPSKAEVERLLRGVHRVLRPGGQLIAMGPNLRFTGGAYWDFWDHHTPITDRSLVEVLELLGFRIAACVPRFVPYTTRSRYPRAPWLVRLYLALPPVWRFFGQQFVVRGVKA